MAKRLFEALVLVAFCFFGTSDIVSQEDSGVSF